jgi:hypothetical protein
MKKISNIIAMLLLIIMLISVITPATKVAASIDKTTSDMQKTVDVFGGGFSTQEIVVSSGKTFDVTFSLCPNMDIPDTAVSFVLPADLVTLVSGSQESSCDLKKNEQFTLALTFLASEDIDAFVKADVEALSSGQKYQSSYYLHVVTSNVEFNSNTASSSMTPGSLRSVNLEYVSTALSVDSSRILENTITPQSTSGTIEVKGRFSYLNEDGGYSSARYMEVRLRDNNDASWSVTGWTNGTGYFDFVVANSASGRSPMLDLIAEGNWDWKGTDSYGAQYWWSTGVLATNVADGWLWTNYGLSPGNNNDILQAGDAVYSETQMIYDWTGWMRSKVTIRWPQETSVHSHGDYIDLPPKTTTSWNHISVQHEEAHCVMWALYGAWPAGSGPDPHYMWSESSGGFAITEGWALFMMCAVDNNPNNVIGSYNGHGGNIETNDWFNCQTNGNMDGNIIEGSTASILWDIFDPQNTAGDKDYLNRGFADIFTVMQNDKPQNMLDFWNDWAARWPDNSTSKGPLCTIYYNYGIDEDWFNPWGSIVINGGATYTNSRTVTLTLDGEDWGVGVQYMRFSEDYGVTWGSWYNYAPTFTYTITSAGDGWKYIDVQYADFWWQSKAGTIYDGIGLDTAPPTGTILIANGSAYTTTRTVTLNLTATDNYSGVALMRFSENMGTWSSWVSFAKTYTYTLTTPNDGTKSVDVQFQDYANNNSTMWVIYDYIYLDTTKPTGTVLINNGSLYTTSTSVYLNLTYTDNGSGISKIRFGNTGDPWSAWETPSPTKAWTLPSGDGTKNVWCQVIDNAGLISDQFYDGIILDTTAPTGSITINTGVATTSSVSVTLYLTYTDAMSGVYQVRYGNSGGSWSAWEAASATKAWILTAGDAAKTVWYQVIDNAGLVSAQYSDTITLNTASIPGYLVVRGSDNQIYYRTYTNSTDTWSSWSVIPGTTTDSPAAAVCGNELHIVVRGADGISLYHGYVTLSTNTFSGWTWITGTTPSPPTLVSNGTALTLIVRGADNSVYYRVYAATWRSWSSWHLMGSGSTCDKVSAVMKNNQVFLVIRGFSTTDANMNNTLWTTTVNVDTGTYPSWTWMPGSVTSSPTLANWQNGNGYCLVVRGTDNSIYINKYVGSAWQGWTALSSGSTTESPAATVIGNKLYIVVVGMDHVTLWTSNKDLNTNAFSGWSWISGTTPSKPLLIS